MKQSLLEKTLLPKTHWWLLALVPITFFGFYPSYFSKSPVEVPLLIHLHSITMLIWLALAIAQPWLIHKNKLTLHRTIGKLSYLLMPFVLISGFFILRYSYHRALSGEPVGPIGYYPDELPLEIKAAEFAVIGTVYWVWLVIYYLLGITVRRNVGAHAIFMLAAALTILGPAGDRLIGNICDFMGWPFNAVAGNFTFGFVFVVFVVLLLFNYKRRQLMWPSAIILLIHIVGILCFFNMPYNPVWNSLAAWLFN
jgi:hypothetical protein